MKKTTFLVCASVFLLAGLAGEALALDWIYDGSFPTSPQGIARFDGCYYSETGLIYFLGGRLEDDSTAGTVWSFDPKSLDFTDTGAVMGTPISNYQCALLDDGVNWGIYIFGGREDDGTQTDIVQVYYPDTNTTATLPLADSMPFADVYLGAAVGVYDNKAFVFGGFNPDATPYFTDECWIFDPTQSSGNRWTDTGSQLTTGRGYIISAVVDDYLYCFGGTDVFDGTALYTTNVCERLDLTDPGSGWDEPSVANCPDFLDESFGVGFDSDADYLPGIVVIPGFGAWFGGGADEFNLCYFYDTVGNTWTLDDDLNQERRNHAVEFYPESVKDDGCPGIWVFGGYDGEDINTMTDSIEYTDMPEVAVIISEFFAVPLDTSVELYWRTVETDCEYGYNIYRREVNESSYSPLSARSVKIEFVKVNDELIIGSTPYYFNDSQVEVGKTYIYRLEAVEIGAGHVAAAAEDTCVMSGYTFALASSFPNPADTYAKLTFTIPEYMAPAHISLSVYDLSGRLVTKLEGLEGYSSGIHSLELNTSEWASGVYSLHLDANSETASGSMVVVH